MDQTKIFVASSERAYELAKMIRDETNTAKYCKAETWSDALASSGAQSKIEALERWIRTYDLAVILFTRDDLWVKQAGQDSKSRDDCIFEAGLFMAALGRQRCILLSSIDTSALPSDLGGITLVKFTEPDNLSNYESCRQAVQYLAGQIQAHVQRITTDRSPGKRPLPRKEILNRERMESLGGMLREDQVVVASVQPPELGYEAARQVRMNMDNNVRYAYFFQGNYDATDKIPQLLQLALLVDFLDEKGAASFKTRSELIAAHAREIVQMLKDYCYNDSLNVFFLGDPVYPEYSIHNATNDKLARLYFKQSDDYFIEWASGLEAYRFWSAIKAQNSVDNPESPDAVFHGGRDFGLDDVNFNRALSMGMRKYFGGIAKEVMDICLKGPDYQRDQQSRTGVPASAVSP